MLYKMTKKEQCYTLFGLALGDGHYRKGRIEIRHGAAQKTYVQWLESECIKAGLTHTAKYDYSYTSRNATFIHNIITIKVPFRRHFDNFDRLYKTVNGKRTKVASHYVLKRITALGILFWWLDDGTLHVSCKNGRTRRFGYLSTESFSEAENKRISRYLLDRFGITTNIHHDGGHCRLYFNATALKRLLDITRDYLDQVPQELRYKLDLKYGIL